MLDGNNTTNASAQSSDVQTDVQSYFQSDVTSDLMSGHDDFDIAGDAGDIQTSATEPQVQPDVQSQADNAAAAQNTNVQQDTTDANNIVNAEILLDVALQDAEVAKRLLSNPSFVAFAQSNPNLAEKLKAVQIQNTPPEPPAQAQQPDDPLFDIARQAAQQANQLYKQMTGNDFDPVLASPEERAYYDLLQKQTMDRLYSEYQQQVQMQQQQQIVQQSLQAVNAAAVQKFGQNFRERFKEALDSIPYGEYQKFDKEFSEAVVTGDINKAISVVERLLAKQANSQPIKQATPVNNVEPVTANNIVPQQASPADVLNEELLRLAEEEF